MSFNTFGKIFRFTTWGESHGPAIGCVVDGCPPNVQINEKEIQLELNKRKPGQSKFTTQRKEEDKVEIKDKILEVKKLADLRLDVTLENGQKWRSVEKIRQVRLKANQKVIISEGFISGYVLKVVDKKISIRVRRIK